MKNLLAITLFPILLLSNEVNKYEDNFLDSSFVYLEDNIYILHNKVNTYTKNIDEYLTNEYDNMVYTDNYIRLENIFDINRFDKESFDSNLTIRIRLKKLEKKLSIEIDNTENKVDENDNNENIKYKDDSFNLGILYNKFNKDINYKIKSGFKLTTNPYFFIKASAQRPFHINENNTITVKEEIRYTNKYDFDNYFNINYNLDINDEYKFINYNEYYINSKEKDDRFYNSIRLHKRINKKEEINYVGSINTDNIESNLKIKEYRVYSSYRRYIKDWLYYDLVPYLSFQDKYNNKINPGIRLNIGIYIGKK